jgi:ribosomal protein S18 acetylase RimI-like enzyme
MNILEATPRDDDILIRHFLAIQESNGTPPEAIRGDARLRALDFIRHGREHRRLGAFLALIDGEVAGSVACELRRHVYPDVVAPSHRLAGYIWSLYVEPARRRRGVARRLVERAVAHLRAVGCTSAVLHASAAGEPLYERLGFEPGREMRLKL